MRTQDTIRAHRVKSASARAIGPEYNGRLAAAAWHRIRARLRATPEPTCQDLAYVESLYPWLREGALRSLEM